MVIKNKLRNIEPVFMDEEHFPVLVTNVGVSSKESEFTTEFEKARVAIEAGTNIISDLSLIANPESMQIEYMSRFNVPFSNVAIYETFCRGREYLITPKASDFILDFEKQAKRGIDLITIHATVRYNDDKLISSSNRLIPTTSRGGAMALKLMHDGNYENPYFEYFDEILDIASDYNVCISLGPMYRPASVWDCHHENELHFLEIDRMSEMVARAEDRGVGIAIEGIGHSAISDIPQVLQYAKSKCNNTPYRVLTVSTDTAMGFDHVSSAISSAVAVQYGASSITCVTRSEHIGIPNADEIRESVFSAKIAAESGFRARMESFPHDYMVSTKRKEHGCFAKSEGFLFVNELEHRNNGIHKGKSCGMCGDYCPFLILDEL